MKLKDELHLLRTAAHSFDTTENRAGCLALVESGSPYDLMFFSELSDPRWLGDLRATGVFDQLPKTARRGDITYYPRHIPLIGLGRLAPTAPADVVAILEKLDVPENPQVHDQIMRIIAAIDDVSYAPKLAQVLEKLFRSKSSSEWIWLDNILTKWFERGAHDSCFQVLRVAFENMASDKGDHSTGEDWQVSEIDRGIVSRLAETHGFEVARLLFDVLRTWAESERSRVASEPSDQPAKRADTDPDYDYPWTYWLEQFGLASIGLHEFESTLAQRLYSVSRTIFESGDRTVIQRLDEMLRQDRWHLFRRLRWQLYADFPAATLDFARRDILERIPIFGHVTARHGYEMASMLEAHARQNGSQFLRPEDVNAFADAVFAGPIDDGSEQSDARYRDRFHRVQLHPIRALLRGETERRFKELASGTELRTDTYKPFSLGGGEAKNVEHISPLKRDQLSAMSDVELWEFLNTWEPSRGAVDRAHWWVEQDVAALGNEFAILVETEPSRFKPESNWWQNIVRPEILYKPLERAATQLEKADTNQENIEAWEWRNWFGLAAWIVEQTSAGASTANSDASQRVDWSWPRIIVVKFVRSVIRSENPTAKSFRPEIGRLLRTLVEDDDSRLTDAEKPTVSDWLTTAINSVRGTAIEALLDLGLSQKRDNQTSNAEPWIFDVITERLRRPNESPAVFAVVGAHLRLTAYLFPDLLGTNSELVLPINRPVERASFLISHFLYDNPMSQIIKAIPTLPSAALDYLGELDGPSEKQYRGDFGSRLGDHLCFYYWNNAFQNEATGDLVLDRFFEIAKPESRAATIGQIPRVFGKSSSLPEHAELYTRVMRLWDRRFATIRQAAELRRERQNDFYGELSEFVRWLECECFPFDWRFDRATQAIRYMDRPPRAYNLIETLRRFASQGRLDEAITLLHAAADKPSAEMRWSYREEHLKPLLEDGLASTNSVTRELAEAIQERLLRDGFFEYLDIGPSIKN